MKKFPYFYVLFLWFLSASVHAFPGHMSSYPAYLKHEMNVVMQEVTPRGRSVLEERLFDEKRLQKYPLSLTLFRPTYVLPYYDTTHPYKSIYINNTPNNEGVMNAEFKAQISFLAPLVTEFSFNKQLSLNVAYTQLVYWQIYARSQYFRETNYEPEIFFEDHFYRNWLFRLGLNHESNGRGGEFERSWNRAIATLEVSGEKWLIDLTAWNLIFKPESSNLHNPNIAHYLGYESLLFSYKLRALTASLKMQNLESLLSRGNVVGTLSYPINKRMALYAEYFNGYGQSLIEYDHRTQGLGVGITFNDWI